MITYAGQPLLLEDPGYSLSTWLERSLSLADLRLFGAAPVALTDGRWIPRSSAKAKVGLPTANWSFPPRLKVNTLWWPTGASRWAIGLFLCGQETLTEILDAVDAQGGADLVLQETETDGQKITFENMHLLPPRPLTTPSDEDDERLFLLPLVDQRYFWQFKDTGNFVATCESSWTDMLSSVGTLLTDQAMSVDAVDSGFSGPDRVELTRRYESAAVLLDALAWCVGQRIVAYPNGDIHSQSASFAKSELTSNLESASVWAGGLSGEGKPGVEPYYEQPRRPASVRVVFPRYVGGEPAADGNVWAVDVAGDAYVSDTSTLVAGRIKTYHDTAMAIFDGGVCTPSNAADLTLLAAAIAEAYYAWLDVEGYDLSFPGLKYWVQNGHDDATWWHWGHLQARGSKDPSGTDFGPEGGAPYAAYTRVASLPADWGFSQLLHQFCPDSSRILEIVALDCSSPGPDCSSSSSSSSSSSACAATLPGGLVGVQLAEQHPGRGIRFEVYLGNWDATLTKWIYDCSTTYTAIDWRYDVPYPAAYSTGLAEWRPWVQ